MSSPAPLRVAMLVGDGAAPAYLADLAARLSAAPGIELEIFALPRGAEEADGRLLRRAYERVDALLFRWPLDALDAVPIRSSRCPERLDGRDVVLNFALSRPAGMANGVRHGVWTVRYEPDWVTATLVYVLRIDACFADGRSVPVHHSVGAVDPASPGRTRQQALWKTSGAIVHRLEMVRRLGFDRVVAFASRRALLEAEGRRSPPPGASPVSRALRAAGGVTWRLVRSAVAREEWFVASRPRPRSPGLETIVCGAAFAPLRGLSSAADPFVFEHGGETFLFVEDDSGPRGRIAVLRLDAHGRPASSPTIALERPYHVSYPFVLAHDGDVFLIPESSENGTVELYRARSFPHHWSLEHVLLQEVRAFDATLYTGEDRLWLFAGVAEAGAMPSDELHVYSASRLEGPWEPHPANPVVADVRSARPAGRIFRHRGELIRPAQDCSGRYGRAVVFNRIDVLTPDDYAETPIARLEPAWQRGVFATHTYNTGSMLEVVDGKRRVHRSPLAWTRSVAARSREKAPEDSRARGRLGAEVPSTPAGGGPAAWPGSGNGRKPSAGIEPSTPASRGRAPRR